MKIWTSYYSITKGLIKANLKPIGISLYPPQWFLMSGQKNFEMLAPSREIFAIKSEAMYALRFNEYLETLDAANIFEALGDLAKGNDMALLCFEKPGEFCHRHLVSKWLERELAISVKEWPFHGHKTTLADPAKPQSPPTLFD
jgi:hypothetical protein